MGSWFSKAKSDFTDADKQQKEQDYIQAMDTLQKQERDLYKAAQEAVAKKKLTLAEQVKRQDEIAAARVKECTYTINRTKELKDARGTLNRQASQLLCAIYYNYQFGYIDDDTSKWKENVGTVIDTCISVEAFWLLCKIPQLLPLLWPTGSNCDQFHEYVTNDKGEPSISDYKVLINAHIKTYVITTLKTILSNVCQSNCKKYDTYDQEQNDLIGSKCKQYIFETENMLSDDEWVKATFEFIKNDDKMNWKCFAARSGKGICKNRIRLLPLTFPKLCPKYELYEALLMITNTVINHYGEIRSESDNVMVPADSKVKHTNGSQCFNINVSWINNAYAASIDNKNIWNGEDYIDVSTLRIDEKTITNKDKHIDWMKETTLCTTTHAYGECSESPKGYLKYDNPTQKYTRQFINDTDNVEVQFSMSRLSAGINDSFTKDFLHNIYEKLQHDDYKFENVSRIDNALLLTSIDYIYIIPNGYSDGNDTISPICRYIFIMLIKNSCKWYFTFPIDNTMSMMKINANMLLSIKNNSNLPQYIWTKSDNVKYTTTSNKAYKYEGKFELINSAPEEYTVK